MSTLSERISFLMNQSTPPVTQTEMSKICHVKPPSVADWISGKTKKMEGSKLVYAVRHFKCNPMWLANGEGNPFSSADSAFLPATNPDRVSIPQYDARGSMGDGLLLRDQSGVIRNLNVNKEWIAKNVKHCTAIENLCVVTGFGDSMRPMFNSGDPLLLDSGVKDLEGDAVYFFRVGDEGFIKRLQRIPGDGIRAISENKGYESWTIRPDMDFEIFGRIIKVWCSEDF